MNRYYKGQRKFGDERAWSCIMVTTSKEVATKRAKKERTEMKYTRVVKIGLGYRVYVKPKDSL